MIRKSLLGLVILGLGAVSASAASSHKVVFFKDVVVNGSTVKAGEYKVEVSENKATLKHGDTVVAAPVKIEHNAERYTNNAVKLFGGEVEEIRLRGTDIRLVFEKPEATASK